VRKPIRDHRVLTPRVEEGRKTTSGGAAIKNGEKSSPAGQQTLTGHESETER